MNKTKVHICYDVDGWCYHNRARAIQKHAPGTFDVTIGRSHEAIKAGRFDYDVVMQLCYGQCGRLRAAMTRAGSKAKLLAGYNAGWGYRLEYFSELQQHADWVVFNNHENWVKTGKPPNTACISNGVDRDVFNVRVPPKQRKPRVLWTGSEFHRQNGDVKGYDALLRPLAERLAADGIECDLFLVDSHGPERRTPEQMAKWYNTGTVYVVASEMEGTPNPALEAASCGCTIVSTRVGNMPELIAPHLNGLLVDRTLDDLYGGIVWAADHYLPLAGEMLKRIQYWGWHYRAAQYYALFRRVLGRMG